MILEIMRIFFILKNLYPNGKASTARVKSYTQGLINQGLECNVIIPISVEKHNQKPINTINEGYHNNVYFKYMSGSPQRDKNIFKRQINDFIGYFKTLLYLKKNLQKNDIIVVYEGGILWHYIVAMITHKVGCKVIMELNELPYGTETQTSKTIKKRKKMLKYVFPKYDGFLTISDTLTELAKKYNHRAKVLKVPILVNKVEDKVSFNNNGIYLFHSGTLTEQKDGILGMIEAFGIALQKLNIPLKYYITGNITDSPHCESIKKIIKQYKLEKHIIFTGYLSNEELNKYQKHCYLTIINKYDTQQNKYCFSTKLGEYLVYKRPVIITNVGEATHYFQNNINAYIIPPHNPHILADKIIEAINHPQENKRIGEEGYKLTLKEFNCHYQAKRIITFFNNINNKI